MLFWYGGKLHWKCAQMEKYDITYTNTKIEIIIRKPQTVSLNGGRIVVASSIRSILLTNCGAQKEFRSNPFALSFWKPILYLIRGEDKRRSSFFKEKQTDVVWEGQVIFLKLVWWYCGVWWPVCPLKKKHHHHQLALKICLIQMLMLRTAQAVLIEPFF